MIMRTFARSVDFTGKTVHPVTTHAMSGLGTSVREYARACPGAADRRRRAGGARRRSSRSAAGGHTVAARNQLVGGVGSE